MINKIIKVLEENDFEVDIQNECTEIQTWTDGGVNEVFYLWEGKELQDFKKYVEYFDIDEEIDMYRTNEDYRNDFTILESVEDFTDYKKRIERVLEQILENTITMTNLDKDNFKK